MVLVQGGRRGGEGGRGGDGGRRGGDGGRRGGGEEDQGRRGAGANQVQVKMIENIRTVIR